MKLFHLATLIPLIVGFPIEQKIQEKTEEVITTKLVQFPYSKHQAYMEQAFDAATSNMLRGQGGPFGAVIVKDGEVISVGWNKVTSSNDPTAHAEVTAIRNATEKLGTFDLSGATLYSSCEPCPMCYAAALWANIGEIYFGNTQKDADAVGFRDAAFYEQLKIQDPSKRKTPMVNIMRGTHSLEAFKLWSEKTDATKY